MADADMDEDTRSRKKRPRYEELQGLIVPFRADPGPQAQGPLQQRTCTALLTPVATPPEDSSPEDSSTDQFALDLEQMLIEALNEEEEEDEDDAAAVTSAAATLPYLPSRIIAAFTLGAAEREGTIALVHEVGKTLRSWKEEQREDDEKNSVNDVDNEDAMEDVGDVENEDETAKSFGFATSTLLMLGVLYVVRGGAENQNTGQMYIQQADLSWSRDHQKMPEEVEDAVRKEMRKLRKCLDAVTGAVREIIKPFVKPVGRKRKRQ